MSFLIDDDGLKLWLFRTFTLLLFLMLSAGYDCHSLHSFMIFKVALKYNTVAPITGEIIQIYAFVNKLTEAGR